MSKNTFTTPVETSGPLASWKPAPVLDLSNALADLASEASTQKKNSATVNSARHTTEPFSSKGRDIHPRLFASRPHSTGVLVPVPDLIAQILSTKCAQEQLQF